MNSKKKHNINYVKPNEPAFITRLKQQAGYVEGPNVETKKEKLEKLHDEDFEDRDDEKPVVVVMNEGDLTAEEADLHEKAKKKVEAVEDKADLTQRVIFKRKKDLEETQNSTESSNPKEVKKKKKTKEKAKKAVLSFGEEDEEQC